MPRANIETEMTSYLVALLGWSLWQIIFSTSLFFGIFFFALIIFGVVGHHGQDLHDKDLHGTHTLEKDLHVDHDIHDHPTVDHDRSLGHLIGEGSIPDATRNVLVYKSNYNMGNISSFLFFFGMGGIGYGDSLTDLNIGVSIILGLLGMKLFSYLIANYAKTIVIPVQEISRGDVAVVVYGISPEKAGMAQVTRRDGVVSTIIAKGAFPHDYFSKAEKGYIWGKEKDIYYITKGIEGQPDLNEPQKKPKKKALDSYETLE